MQTEVIETPSHAHKAKVLLIPLGRNQGSAIELTDFFSIGRAPGNSLSLPNDSFVSARHARIELRTNGYVIRDQQSRNGVFVNGTRVLEATLALNDHIRIGETTFAFANFRPGVDVPASRNDDWNNQLKRLPAFAATGFSVLINGPSGSGKEVIAQWIHEYSPRNAGPFISINCGALSANLIESELFGHVRGSFTGATHDRKGAFEAARGGTIFLDEIGDLPIDLQPKLLRALENHEIRPVGNDRTVSTDVRVLAATHNDLVNSVHAGKFREDLFYRLNVCNIRPPALIERMEDFDDLLYGFAKKLRVRFSHNAILKLKEHTWPGNIRELKNAVSRAAAYFPGEQISPENIPALIDQDFARSMTTNKPSVNQGTDLNYKPSMPVIKEIEREMIIQRLVANKGNQRRTADDLGMPKSTLHDRLKTYDIDLDKIMKSSL